MNAEPKIRPVVKPVAQKIIESITADAEPKDAFTEARPRSGEDIMLDVRFSDGKRKAFSYSFLAEIDYDPGDTVRLIFGTCKIRMEGRRLLRLYEALQSHKAKYVQEGSAAEDDLKPEETPHIDEIRIEEEE